jgi:protein-disulfide isomerase
MVMNRILFLLIVLTCGMQGLILSKQHNPPKSGRSAEAPVRDAGANDVIELADLPIKGATDARVVLLEFSDYECPFCIRHATSVGRDLEKQFVASGKLRMAFLNNPLPTHPNARLLATAAICAGQQDLYWRAHDILFSVNPATKIAVITAFEGLGLNTKTFQKCLDDTLSADKVIDRDVQVAKKFRLGATPSFALGQVDSTGRLRIKKYITGAQPAKVFQEAINKVIEESRV